MCYTYNIITGTSKVIFGYNGRDGVITDDNGLIYMRARYYSPEMKRFINADIIPGKLSNAVTLNRFAYANGNPVSFVDPFGLSPERGMGPTPLEAAYLASHIYNATSSDYDTPLGVDYGGWELINIYDPGIKNIGLKVGVYKKDIDGKINYCLAYAGTNMDWLESDGTFVDFLDSVSDWRNNIYQPLGLSIDMLLGINFAKNFKNDNQDSNITIVGHSKGGAEAAAAAVATNSNSILFNPASVALNEYGLNSKNYTANMTAYVVNGEILNNIFGAISKPIDNFQYIYYNEGDSITKHTMDAVIPALKEENQ